jgi:hypothetical protein
MTLLVKKERKDDNKHTLHMSKERIATALQDIIEIVGKKCVLQVLSQINIYFNNHKLNIINYTDFVRNFFQKKT